MDTDPGHSLSVLLVGDAPIIRKGWQLLIEENPRLELYGICTLEDLTSDPGCADVDAVLLNCHRRRCCLESIRTLRRYHSSLPILVVSSEETNHHDEPINAEQIRKAGADRFVLVSQLSSEETRRTLANFFAEQAEVE